MAVAVHPDAVQTDAAFKALAEPRRRAILRLVRDDELPAGRIASHFDVTRPAVSQHLRVLADAGLVAERRDGTRRLYRARPEAVARLREELDDFWSDRLSRLRDAAEAEQRRRDGAHHDPRPTRHPDDEET